MIECLLCREHYTQADIVQGRYHLETLICSKCYSRMQRASYEQSCFGKPMEISVEGKQQYGYDVKAKECNELCPDRVICRRILIGKRISGDDL